MNDTERGKLLAAVRSKLRKKVTEDTIEGHLVKRVQGLGGVAVKLMMLPGWPDRLVLLPGAVIMFVELKRPHGGKDEPRQPRVQRMLRGLGFTVLKLNTKEAVDAALEKHHAHS